MSVKTTSIGALFVALVIILAVKPYYINSMYNSILGRILLIGIVIFFSTNNLTLGLLVALVIITASNQFSPFVEGMENGTTIGEDNTESTGTQKVLTREAVLESTPEKKAVLKKLSELKSKSASKSASKTNLDRGVDKESITNSIRPKESKTIPIDPNAMKSDDVSASTSSMLKHSSLEGFSAYASV